MFESTRKFAAVLCMTAGLGSTGWAADPPAAAVQPADLARLKAQLDEQQKLIDQLRAAIEEQKKMLEQAGIGASTQAATPKRTTPAAGLVASTTPMLPPVSAAAPAAPAAPRLDPPAPQAVAAAAPATAPLQIRIGDVGIMPVGFLDLTAVLRDKNAGSGIGSNFGSVPYYNSTAGQLSEFRFSPQNSRLGFRIDGDWKGAHFIGYNEFDFLGTSGANNIGIVNGAFVPRLRLYWVDVRKSKFEFLAGQSWSMLTPNRKGISALPGDLFYSQVMDVNYVAGLTWTRQPGVRFLYHPNDQVTMGISLENPNQYGGGYGGGGQIVAPSALTSMLGSQLDNGTASYLSTPDLHPDIIGKVAFDPNGHAHVELAGFERTFKTVNPNTFQTFTKAAGGGSINANFEIVKGFRLVTNNFWSDGGGRYLFGEAPDAVIRTDGSLSAIHTGGMVQGFEAQLNPKFQLWGYYGLIYIGKNVVIDTNGKPVGYGYSGSGNGQNRNINEATIGFTQTFWKDPKYGALSLIGQYEYLTRNPWYVAAGQPKSAHDNTIYLDLRYTLPGAPPPAK
ncbi:MAG TPA: hypothetical protein VMH28_13325 [Candidatus Acidoferrales bacterium]|nr:hypothetical protein [Candidatus Acidoferrales bacterium]